VDTPSSPLAYAPPCTCREGYSTRNAEELSTCKCSHYRNEEPSPQAADVSRTCSSGFHSCSSAASWHVYSTAVSSPESRVGALSASMHMLLSLRTSSNCPHGRSVAVRHAPILGTVDYAGWRFPRRTPNGWRFLLPLPLDLALALPPRGPFVCGATRPRSQHHDSGAFGPSGQAAASLTVIVTKHTMQASRGRRRNGGPVSLTRSAQHAARSEQPEGAPHVAMQSLRSCFPGCPAP
jgi:hypothetical protein